MSKAEKATKKYLQTLSKDRVIELCLQYIFDKNVVETQLEEKDKEIEEKMMSFEKRCQEYYKSNEFKRDFAIQELEKVKVLAEKLLEDFCNSWQYNQRSLRGHRHIEYYDLIQGIDNQIKELSNNTFKCEICGEITPKECEGAEPNVCVDCVPIETHAVSSSDLLCATKKGCREQSID